MTFRRLLWGISVVSLLTVMGGGLALADRDCR